MAYVKSADTSYFTEKAYSDYLHSKAEILNSRLRAKDETFVDVLLSKEADFTQDEAGKDIIDTLRRLEW
jgi:hypothetical protein